MTTIPESRVTENTLGKNISAFFKEHRIGQALRKSNAYKSKGVAVTAVFSYLVELVFTKKSMYMNILNETNKAGFGKDVVYRLLNATYINWATFLLNIASAVITGIAALILIQL